MDRQLKKKKIRFYEAYIAKLLKKLKPSSGITSNSKQQLNSVLCSISKILAKKILSLTHMLGKKTISCKEVCAVVEITFGDSFAKHISKRGKDHLQMFNDEVFRIKGVSRQDRAGIIFPLSIAERFLRNFGYTKIMLTNSASLFLAFTLEIICEMILKNACKNTEENKRVRITIRDLELSIRSIKELDTFFCKHNIQLLGGGVVPYIHPKLTEKTKKRVRGERKTSTHRFRPGTVSLREIKKHQKSSNCLTLARHPFEKLVRNQLRELTNFPVKISKDFFTVLQYFTEQEVVRTLKKANFAAIHANRVKLTSTDINFIRKIEEEQNPFVEEEDEQESEEEPEIEKYLVRVAI